MNIVVTGASSFVGAKTVDELLRRGHHVYAVLREHSTRAALLFVNGEKPSNLTIIEEDLGALENLRTRIDEKCDVFLHMGWKGAGSESRKNGGIQKENVTDSLSAVRTAKALGCQRFLFTGSQAEYGICGGLMTEETPCHPTSPYGEAKLEVCHLAESLCRTLDMDYGHIRIFSTYGPGDHPWTLVSSCLRTFLSDGDMELSDCAQKWNFLYIDDAARAIAALAEYDGKLASHGCVYNLAGPMEETKVLREFVEQMRELCGGGGSCSYGSHPANAEGTANLEPDIGKLKRVVQWTPEVGFRQGILKILRKS